MCTQTDTPDTGAGDVLVAYVTKKTFILVGLVAREEYKTSFLKSLNRKETRY